MAFNMVMKTSLCVLAVGALLAGCAAGPARTGVQPQDLRDESRLVTELLLADMDFPTLQSRLFQHREACGSAPRFVMQKGETGRASLIETSEIPTSYENVILADLTHYPESLRSGKRVAVQVYSYYYNADIEQRKEAMLDAVRRPGVCIAPSAAADTPG